MRTLFEAARLYEVPRSERLEKEQQILALFREGRPTLELFGLEEVLARSGDAWEMKELRGASSAPLCTLTE